MAARLSSDLSYARLCDLGLLDRNERSSPPERMPRHDDEDPFGFSVFRTRLDDTLDLSDLSLPRSFFGRSEINRVSFRNTDLHESNLCWNDFLGTDFTEADLTRSDMRSSIFQQVAFVNANLDGADLRGSSFTDCNFEGATMRGVALAREQSATMHLSEAQRLAVEWHEDSGPYPDGG
jgi:BTB/POZ domain-containing protein KCTD9